MFWKQLHHKYKDINSNDPDIQKYFQIMDRLQSDGYNGLMGKIQDIGHKYVAKYTANGGRILEIGFGKGRSNNFFRGDIDNYFPLDINEKYVDQKTWGQYKNATIGSATKLPFEDNTFDQVVSIYNLEHIQDIDQALSEIRRVLKKKGEFIVALPCEDGFLWNVGRALTSRRVFKKKYKINYDKVIAFEHRHNLRTLIGKLTNYFNVKEERYFPCYIPIIDINLIYTCRCENG